MSDDQRRFNTFSFHYRPELIQEREVVEHLAAILEVEALPFRTRHDHFLKIRVDEPESLLIPGILDGSNGSDS